MRDRALQFVTRGLERGEPIGDDEIARLDRVEPVTAAPAPVPARTLPAPLDLGHRIQVGLKAIG